ncbi:MAG: pre-toxin TG domain-containing protein [bacterium]
MMNFFLSLTGDSLKAKVVSDGILGDFLILGSERRFIPTSNTTNEYLKLLGQRSVEQISTEELQTYIPKDALDKIEPPPPPPKPKKEKWYQKVWSVVSGVVSTVVRGLPGIGQIYSFACAIAGRDFITGQKLSGVDQWLSLLGPLARGASMFKQTANLAGTINKTRDAIAKLNTYSGYLKNPEQAFLAGLNLGKKYDLGHLSSLTNKAGSLYNSLIENKYYKFGTALTGKDVWGNKLTWEERVAGLKSYQRNSDWNKRENNHEAQGEHEAT